MQPLYINNQTITVSQSLTYSYNNYLEWVGLNNPTHQFSPKQTYFFLQSGVRNQLKFIRIDFTQEVCPAVIIFCKCQSIPNDNRLVGLFHND